MRLSVASGEDPTVDGQHLPPNSILSFFCMSGHQPPSFVLSPFSSCEMTLSPSPVFSLCPPEDFQSLRFGAMHPEASCLLLECLHSPGYWDTCPPTSSTHGCVPHEGDVLLTPQGQLCLTPRTGSVAVMMCIMAG